MSAAEPRQTKAERTRAQILAAAERHFAHSGYSDARLEDIAEVVGLKRAALFYHFPDKQSLYDAVVDEVSTPLVTRVGEILDGPGGAGGRLEAAVGAFVDYLGERPSLAHLLLRAAADVSQELRVDLMQRDVTLLERGRRLVEEGVRRGELDPVRPDPFHVAAAVAGSTVFYIVALNRILPSTPFDPLDPEQLATHRRDVLRTARRLLGIRSSRRVARRKRAPQRRPR